VYRGTVKGTVTNSVSIRASVHGHAYDKQFPASHGNFNGTGPAQCLGLGPKVSIAASPAVTTLLDSEVLRARLTPSTPRASSYKFEIKRPAQAGWTVLRTTPKSGIQFTVKIAGHFEVRVVATVQGRRLFSHPQNLAVRFPSYGKVVSDPRVQAFTAAAWQRTLNRAKPASRREEGFWIGINTCKGRYGQTASVLGPLVGPNQTGSVVLGNRPPDKPLAPRLTGCAVYIIVSFHTHTPTRYRPFARAVGPSAADGRVDAADDVIGIVYDYVANPLASGNVPAHYPLNSPARLYRSGPLRRSTPP
jgi:hypothetical protein